MSRSPWRNSFHAAPPQRPEQSEEDERPFYERAKKITPCKKAIENLHAVQANRPLSPPGKKP